VDNFEKHNRRPQPVQMYLLTSIVTASIYLLPAQAQTAGESGGGYGSAGSTGASSGSQGMSDDSDGPFLKDVQKAKKFGVTSREYIGSLCELGMHYSRKGQYAVAQKKMTEALAIVDKGALKPTKGSVEEKSPTVVEHSDGTVSATINKPPAPYEETLEQLLPALIEADINSNHLIEGETHVKRLIDMAQKNRIHKVPGLMFAYNQYAEILAKMHRTKEAKHYKDEADKINKSFRPL
jgi:tetratricopeptide (TPR) repeat protein